ncbi:XRE family transcriptional regulator [Prosthecobacter fusiformis]|uniref:XRE family transcriptional regulator n=1 Tax=Prosthecobacter fusiformis TaxID=48464 RepID=A0A4R7RNL8_9BACT|nr:XRE family transcriptional regulator [Prosthecobacter fusiformis]TDU66619.1 XRE family transcriptional regulator [Prosthecobacter fusiformis]
MATKKSARKTAPLKEMAPEEIGEFVGRRVKKLRTDRGWSLEELAQVSGVSRSMLSEIERERANPTLTVTFRIARAFGLSLQELIGSVEMQAAKIQVIRSRDRGQVFRSDKQCEIRTLSPLNLEKDVEFYELKLRVGGALRSQSHFEGTREFLTVEEGCVRVESDDAVEELGKGDSGTYPVDVPHAIVNTGTGDAVVFLVVIYR